MDCFLQYGNNQNKGDKFQMIGYPFQYGDELTP
jgi:hypothetical protein